jgi:hypothetical protein
MFTFAKKKYIYKLYLSDIKFYENNFVENVSFYGKIRDVNGIFVDEFCYPFFKDPHFFMLTVKYYAC